MQNKQNLLFELSDNGNPITDDRGNVIESCADVVSRVYEISPALADTVDLVLKVQHEQQLALIKETLTSNLEKDLQLAMEAHDIASSEYADYKAQHKTRCVAAYKLQQNISYYLGEISVYRYMLYLLDTNFK